MEEVSHNAAEFLGKLLVGKVARALDDCELSALEILAEGTGGRWVYGTVFAAPDQQGRNVRNLRQDGLEFLHVLIPEADDLYRVLQDANPQDRS